MQVYVHSLGHWENPLEFIFIKTSSGIEITLIQKTVFDCDNSFTETLGLFCKYTRATLIRFFLSSLCQGVRVFIEKKAQLTLLGTEMDYIEDKLSSEFVFNNPNIKGTCGCGESFNI